MIWAFFTVGSIWFWSIFILEFILLTMWVEQEDAAWSFGSVVVFLLAIHLFGDINLLAMLRDEPMNMLQLVGVYIVIGIVWGVVKFYFYNAKFQRKVERLKEDFNKQYEPIKIEDGDSDVTEDKQREWKQYIKDNLDYQDRDRMELSNQSGKVIFWMSYWPMSAFWTILNDPLRRFGEMLYDMLFVKIFKVIHKQTVGKSMEL